MTCPMAMARHPVSRPTGTRKSHARAAGPPMRSALPQPTIVATAKPMSVVGAVQTSSNNRLGPPVLGAGIDQRIAAPSSEGRSLAWAIFRLTFGNFDMTDRLESYDEERRAATNEELTADYLQRLWRAR